MLDTAERAFKMIAEARSQNGIRIRLTEERWLHILRGHPELAAWQQEILRTIEQPERIFAGKLGELLAVREMAPGKWLVVVYRNLKTMVSSSLRF
ncbi:MAG TPA: hypothetical protein VNK89_12765 [Thermoflexus sp.]|nr:hypothetical protein [Thermoflexus sp.]